jgi:hypothetical protein
MNYFPQFWGFRVIYKDHDTSYIFERHDQNFDFMAVLERNEKNSSFLRLWPFLWTIAHSFEVLGWFTRSMTLSTYFSGMTLLLHFRAIFMSYCPQFWGSEVIYKAHDTQYIFDRHDQNLIIFAFSAIFMSYCS